MPGGRRADWVIGRLGRAGGTVRTLVCRLDDRPLMMVIVAGVMTLGVTAGLGWAAGWPHVRHVVLHAHPWLWLAGCAAGEVVAYLGYALTLRDVARVDGGPGMDIGASTKAVVAGFGVFSATRGAGGFAVDYWALRAAGAGRRDATARVLALGFLEYTVLSIVALVASAALFFRLDGRAAPAVTLPALVFVPTVVAALWLTSPKRVARLARATPGSGAVRRMFGNAILGLKNVRRLLLSPREHGVGVLGMTLYWAGDIFCLWAALQVVGAGRMSASSLVLAYSGGYVLTRRSLPAGGAGVVEIALTLALTGMGAGFVHSLLAVAFYRLFNFWLPIVPALLLIPVLRDLRSRFDNVQRAATQA